MKDSYVHYHAFPRYNNESKMFGKIWSDNNPLYNLSLVKESDEKLLKQIKDYMCQ